MKAISYRRRFLKTPTRQSSTTESYREFNDRELERVRRSKEQCRRGFRRVRGFRFAVPSSTQHSSSCSFLFFLDKTVCMIVIVIETVWFQKITDVMWIFNN